MEQNINERRKELRHEADWPVFLRSDDGKKQIGDVADISLSGIKIMLSDTDKISSAARSYDLYLYRTRFPMDLVNIAGRVVWSAQAGHNLTIGLELKNLDADTRKILKEYIDNKEELTIQMDLEV
ncbi:MAG: PilZ domain-containing protein [Spirochaetales bacterium]|nr:PilZ domain-containing protein [Spirochaetales bacterium]